MYMYMACIIIRSEAKAKIFYFIYTKKTNRKPQAHSKSPIRSYETYIVN